MIQPLHDRMLEGTMCQTCGQRRGVCVCAEPQFSEPYKIEGEDTCFACGFPEHDGGCMEAHPRDMLTIEIARLEKQIKKYREKLAAL